MNQDHSLHSALRRRALLAAAAGAAASSPLAWGQSAFPNRPIKIIVATVPGSGPDIAVRRLAGPLGEILKQPVVVENRPGANGILAASEVAKAPKDGYTLLDANIGNALNDLLRPPSGTRLNEDLLALSDLTAGPLILLVHPSVPARTAKELVDLARANPTLLNYGSGGPGSLIQLTGERLKAAMNFSMTEVPYKSFGADLVDLVAGNVQVGFSVWSLVAPQLRAGRLRALAVASDKRIAVASDIPTMAEAGMTAITATGWNGLFLPAGTPDDVVQTLSRAVMAAVRLPEFQDFFVKDGNEVGGKTPEQFANFIRAEQSRYAQIIQKANIKLE